MIYNSRSTFILRLSCQNICCYRGEKRTGKVNGEWPSVSVSPSSLDEQDHDKAADKIEEFLADRGGQDELWMRRKGCGSIAE